MQSTVVELSSSRHEYARKVYRFFFFLESFIHFWVDLSLVAWDCRERVSPRCYLMRIYANMHMNIYELCHYTILMCCADIRPNVSKCGNIKQKHVYKMQVRIPSCLQWLMADECITSLVGFIWINSMYRP